jgi:hypothetical protein
MLPTTAPLLPIRHQAAAAPPPRAAGGRRLSMHRIGRQPSPGSRVHQSQGPCQLAVVHSLCVGTACTCAECFTSQAARSGRLQQGRQCTRAASFSWLSASQPRFTAAGGCQELINRQSRCERQRAHSCSLVVRTNARILPQG